MHLFIFAIYSSATNIIRLPHLKFFVFEWKKKINPQKVSIFIFNFFVSWMYSENVT